MVAQAVHKSRGMRGCVRVCECTIYTGTLLRRNIVLKSIAKMYNLANTSAVCGQS